MGELGIEGGEFELSLYTDLLLSADFLVAHNGKFDVQWLHRAGVPLEKILLYDTMIGEYVIAGNRKWRLNLDDTAARYGAGQKNKYISKMIKAGICPSELPRSFLKDYGRKDVIITERIFLQQRQYLFENGLLPVFFSRCIFTPVLADAELRGMYLDKELVMNIHKESEQQYLEIINELNEITGGINMASPKQVSAFLYDTLGFEELKDRRGNPKRTAAGGRLTDEETIGKLIPKDKKQKRFLELKGKESKLRKRISSYTELFMDAVEHNDCMIYGRINQTITSTHRLSSSDPNLQNIDRELKKVVTARHPDYRIHEIDYAQLEFRVAGLLAQDKKVLEVINNHEDVHSFTGSIIYHDLLKMTPEEAFPYITANKDKDKLCKKIRQDSKPHTFKPLYGGTSGTKKEQAYYKAFLERYPQVKEMQDRWVQEALSTQRLRTITGLIFYFPGTRYTESGYVENSTSIKNYPVQMFATADIATIGATLVWHELKARKLKSFLINEVHDSIILEDHIDEVEEIRNFSTELLSKGVVRFMKQLYGIDINVPLEVEHKVTTNWAWNKEKAVG